jgi:hypothetical protein
MPEKKTLKRVSRAKRAGQSTSTQAGAFAKEQIGRSREGVRGRLRHRSRRGRIAETLARHESSDIRRKITRPTRIGNTL